MYDVMDDSVNPICIWQCAGLAVVTFHGWLFQLQGACWVGSTRPPLAVKRKELSTVVRVAHIMNPEGQRAAVQSIRQQGLQRPALPSRSRAFWLNCQLNSCSANSTSEPVSGLRARES